MSSKKALIKLWLQEGQAEGANYLLVVCDMFDYEDYPVKVKGDLEVLRTTAEHYSIRMQRVMECYDLSLDLEKQLAEFRAWHGWRPNDSF